MNNITTAVGLRAGIKALARLRGYAQAIVLVMWSGPPAPARVILRGVPPEIIKIASDWCTRLDIESQITRK